jgi:hypothetical protein
VGGDVLSDRALNRATLARQLLLRRSSLSTWRIERNRRADSALLVIDHVVRLPKRAASSIAAEGRRLVRFVAADAAARDVRFVSVE